jgi:hypothetical protein
MAKNNERSSESRQAPSIQRATSGTINVFNTGFRQVGQAIRVHSGGVGAKGPPLRIVKFLPGNNEVDQADWEKCKKSRSVKAWLSAIDRYDLNGNLVRGKTLIEGHVDNRFTSTSTDLATRMADAQRTKRALSA